MNIRKYFESSSDPDITAAIVGIYKGNWMAAKPNESDLELSDKMAEYRFDILPVMETDGRILKCCKTKVWGRYEFENIEVHHIVQEDKIYFLTSIHDVIVMFVKKERNFFFLDNYSDIVGLITIANLNSKHVYLYLYNLIIQLEHLMGTYLYKQEITDHSLISFLKNTSKHPQAKYIVEKFRDAETGYDNRFIEYIYLSNYGEIFNHFKLTEKIDLTNEELIDKLKKINIVRNIVAHPGKSLINSVHSISDLYESIKGIHELINKLKQD